MRIAVLSVICVIGFCIAGCGGAEQIGAPEITSATMGTTSVTVFWRAETEIESHADFQGYNVYVSTDSTELLVDDGEELNKYNASVITDTMFEIRNLNTQHLYYIQIRTLNTDDKVGAYNANVPFVTASPRPVFAAKLMFQLNDTGVDDSCAIRFKDAFITSDSLMAIDSADMWADYGGTAPNDTVMFKTPRGHFQYGGMSARETYFVNVGQYDLDEVTEVIEEPSEFTVAVVAGDLILAKTEDGHYVKIHVDAVDVTDSTVTFTYAYQDVANFPKLSP